MTEQRALIVYESLWGNTAALAEAIAGELRHDMSVELVTAEEGPPSIDDFDLVVVGGPTHAFSMSRPATRQSAVENNGAASAPARGIREWLADLAPAGRPVRVAAFDTRVDSPRLPGSAAKAARHELRSLGFDTAVKAESFHVHGYSGPLVDGDRERAVRWARRLRGGTSPA